MPDDEELIMRSMSHTCDECGVKMPRAELRGGLCAGCRKKNKG